MKKIMATKVEPKRNENEARDMIRQELERMTMVLSYFEGCTNKEYLEHRGELMSQYAQARNLIETLQNLYIHEYELVEQYQTERRQMDAYLEQMGLKSKLAEIVDVNSKGE